MFKIKKNYPFSINLYIFATFVGNFKPQHIWSQKPQCPPTTNRYGDKKSVFYTGIAISSPSPIALVIEKKTQPNLHLMLLPRATCEGSLSRTRGSLIASELSERKTMRPF